MAERLHEGWDDRRVLVKFKGGPFRVSDLTQWLHAIDPQALQSLPRAPDEDLVDLLRLLTQRHILVLTADAAGISLDAADLDRLRAEHDSGMAAVRRVLQLSPEALSAAPADGEDIAARVATANVNDYLERLLSGRAAFVPVPPVLAAHLRRHARWEVSTAGVAEAIGRATASRAAADSLSAGTQEEPGLQPAPGPAPVPGGGR
jgi:hypothetical protein